MTVNVPLAGALANVILQLNVYKFVAGTHAPAVAVKAASHYRLGLHLEFEQLQYD